MAFEYIPGPLARRVRLPVPGDPGWSAGFAALDSGLPGAFPSAAANAEGRFRFLTQERELDARLIGASLRPSQLWRYHLHYFEWAWAFAARRPGVGFRFLPVPVAVVAGRNDVRALGRLVGVRGVAVA